MKIIQTLAGLWPIRSEVECAQSMMRPSEIDVVRAKAASYKMKIAAWASALASVFFILVSATADIEFSSAGAIGLICTAALAIAFAFLGVYLRALANLLDDPGIIIVEAKTTNKSGLTKKYRWVPLFALYIASLFLVAKTPGAFQTFALCVCIGLGVFAVTLYSWGSGDKNE